MAMSDKQPVLGEVNEARVRLRWIVLGTLLALVVLFATGAWIGAALALMRGTRDPGSAQLVIAGAIVVILPSLWAMLRLKPQVHPGEPVSPRTRKANQLLVVAMVLGGALGAALAIGTLSLEHPFALFSNSPISPTVVIPALVVFLVGVPVLSWMWHRSVDEHEAAAYGFGGLAGLYLYTLLAPSWWLAWRGGLVPAPDTMIVYAIVMAVWGVSWFWRRYR